MRACLRRIDALSDAAATIAVLTWALGPSAPASAQQEPPMYRALAIEGGANPVDVNDAGTVVGTRLGPIRAWVSQAGAPAQWLPLPPGMASSWANDINEAGVIVGAVGPSSSPEFAGSAAAWIPTRAGYDVVILGALPGHSLSDAVGLNDVGDIVGFSSNGTYRTPVLFSLAAPPTSLAATGLFDPQAVNNDRLVVDRSFTAKRLDLDTMQVDDLGTPGAGYLATTATDIDANGRICGVAIRTSTTCDREAAEYLDEIGWRILSICGPYNGAQDLNDLGDLTFSAQLMQYVRFGDESPRLIESLIDDVDGPWYPFSFTALPINNARHIALNASHPSSGFGGAVLLVPIGIPEDLDGNGTVEAADLTILLADWGACDGCAADLDGDGSVGGGDLATLLAAWGSTGR